MTGVAQLTQIHAEGRNDFGVCSTVLVYLHDRTGDLVIVERFTGDDAAAWSTHASRTVISAEGVAKIADHLRPPPATETHGNPDLDATIEARRAEIRYGGG